MQPSRFICTLLTASLTASADKATAEIVKPPPNGDGQTERRQNAPEHQATHTIFAFAKANTVSEKVREHQPYYHAHQPLLCFGEKTPIANASKFLRAFSLSSSKIRTKYCSTSSLVASYVPNAWF